MLTKTPVIDLGTTSFVATVK